jgi:rhodanese-related sulfurtransferase
MTPGSRPQKTKILLEGLLVAVVGLLLGLGANQVSPRGINLRADIFRVSETNTPVVKQPGRSPREAIEAKGFRFAESNLVYQLFQDPRYGMELVVFIDARDDKHYQEGHIPGAYQLDPYYLEKYLLGVLPACMTAEQIVFYCNGGDCEDSLFAAMAVADQRIPKDKLYIYGGGMTEWSANGWPVETGARKSGMLRSSTPNPATSAK